MPALRTRRNGSTLVAAAQMAVLDQKHAMISNAPKTAKVTKKGSFKYPAIYNVDDDNTTTCSFPRSQVDRENVINKHTGKRITPFQFKVYDLCAQIPEGQISTYKHLSDTLNAAPQAVGQALKVNPFAPLPVPCHRVLDSKLFVGGFQGEWGEGIRIESKKAKLAKEGVFFDETDHVAKDIRDKVIFKSFAVDT